MVELAQRARTQAPPPWVIWEALVDPHRPGGRPWLEIAASEIEPTVIEAVRPHLVVWSSLWDDRSRDRIRFIISEDGSGSRLKWVLETDDEPPDAETLDTMRHHI